MPRFKTILALGALLATVGLLSAAAGERHVIGQKDKVFASEKDGVIKEVTVKVGDSIVFKNDDDIVHNVYSKSSCCAFEFKAQAPGTKNEVTFEKEGTVEVRCAIHPKMKLTVHVKK